MFKFRFRSGGLITQLLTFVGLPILLVLVLVSYAGINLHDHAMRELVGERDQRALRAAVEALSDRFSQRQMTLTIIADQLTSGAKLAELLATSPTLKNAFDAGLIVQDSKNAVVDQWIPGEKWAPPPMPQNAAWALDHDREVPLVILQGTNTRSNLRVWGGVSLNSLNVSSTLGLMQDNPQVRLYLVAEDGHLLQDTGGAPIGTDASNWPGVNLGSPDQATIEHHHSDLITVSTFIPQLGWTLVVQESWQTVVNPALQLSLIAPLAMIPAVIISLFVVLFGLTRIVWPLRRLGRAASQLAWGDYELIQAGVGGVQEVSDLQKTLAEMARRLQQAQAGMHSYIGAVLQGQEDERKRLSRELHDDTLQSLIALDQRRQMAQRTLSTDPEKASNHLQQLHEMLDALVKNLRSLIRDMRPSYLEDLGLMTALETLCTQFGTINGIEVKLQIQGMPRRLPINHELSLYRITQEALTNALRHGNATQIRVQLAFEDGLALEIIDNGGGFALPERPAMLATNNHYGLMGMVERTEQMRGRFHITSTPGKGTTVEVIIGEAHPSAPS